MKDLDRICADLLPTSPNWSWSWVHLKTHAGMELRGVYKGETKAIIRTNFGYSLLLNNPPKVLEYIKKTVDSAEKEAIIIDTPLHKAMREK